MKSTLLFTFLGLTQLLLGQTFTELTETPFQGVRQSSIAFADIDGDDDMDVLITGLNVTQQDPVGTRTAKLFTNDGSGNFTEVMNTPFEGVDDSSIAFADVDGDNDQDVLITGRSDSSRIAKLYTNDGFGNFSEVLGTSFEGLSRGSISFVDIDADNDQDVLITGQNTSFSYRSKLYINDGLGNFTEVTGTPFEGVIDSATAFEDIDGDNDQDVLITGTGASGNGHIAKLYTNDGSGVFTEMMNTTFDGVGSGAVAFADVDGDNDQDVFISGSNNSNTYISKLYVNDGFGDFAEMTGTPFAGLFQSAVAFADVDDDNDQDLFLSGGTNSLNFPYTRLFTNDGSGNFAEAEGTPFSDVIDGSIAVADVDGDSDMDVLITGVDLNIQYISKLYINGGVLSSDDFNADINLTIYPNPVRDVLKIQTNHTIETIEIFNMNGQLIMSDKRTSTQLYLESLDSGIYLLRIKTDAGFATKKIVKL